MKSIKSEGMDWLESNRFVPEPSLSERRPNRRMAWCWIGIAGLAGFTLIAEWYFGAILFFAPGWANGWPWGLSFELVVSAGMTAYISLMLMTASTGAGAIIAHFEASTGVRAEDQWQFFIRWLCITSAVVVCLSSIVFLALCAWVAPNFPDG
jgi:hypothetical protein